MNWEAVAAVAELLGAIAVIASLAYLAIQVRHNTRTLRMAASRDAASGILEWHGHVMSDLEMARVFRIGAEDLEQLSEDERAQFAMILFSLLKMVETMHFQYLEGAMDSQIWNGWDDIFRQYMVAPGFQQYWQDRRSAFSQRFRLYVDSLSDTGDAKRTDHFARVASG